MNWQTYLRSLAARFFHRSEVAAEMEEEPRGFPLSVRFPSIQ